MQPQDLQALMAKAENGELTEQEQLELLKEINFSYDVLTKFLEEVKMEELKAEIQ